MDFAVVATSMAKSIEALKLAQARYERPEHLGELELTITPPKPPTRTMLDEYAALGISRIVPMLGFYNEDTISDALEQMAIELISN